MSRKNKFYVKLRMASISKINCEFFKTRNHILLLGRAVFLFEKIAFYSNLMCREFVCTKAYNRTTKLPKTVYR